MKKIVVGYDGTVQGHDALALSSDFAHAFGADLVVTVVDEIDPLADRIIEPADRAARLEDLLEEASALLDDVDFEPRTIRGSAPECLQLVAEEISADAIVIGSTHRGTFGSVVPGSVGGRLLAGAPCPVAVAPVGYRLGPNRYLRKISVAYDGAPESRAALKLASELAASADAVLRIVGVTPASTMPEPGRISSTSPGYAAMMRTHFREILEEARASGDVVAKLVLLEGDAAEKLAEESAATGLLVLGSRGYGPIRRTLLGGVASKLVRTAHCPVVITPRSSLRGRLDAQAKAAVAQ